MDLLVSIFDPVLRAPGKYFVCIAIFLRFFEKGVQKVGQIWSQKVQFPYVLVWDGHRFILRMAHLVNTGIEQLL